jgi:uncharacterized protein YbcV (DUF1398 family)
MTKEQALAVRECAEASVQGTQAFPQIVARLIEAGVERYHADFSRGEITYYLHSGASDVVPVPRIEKVAARDFLAEGVRAAVRASQAGEIRFPEFVDRAAAAGCVGYFAQLSGRKVIYFGRNGESHTELFPGTK